MDKFRQREIINFSPTGRIKVTDDHLKIDIYSEINEDDKLIRDESRHKNNKMKVMFHQKFFDDFGSDQEISIVVTQISLMWQKVKNLGVVKNIKQEKPYYYSDILVDRPDEPVTTKVLVYNAKGFGKGLILGRFQSINRNEGLEPQTKMKELLGYETADIEEWVRIKPDSGHSDQEEPTIIQINNKIGLDREYFSKQDIFQAIILPNTIRSICQKHVDYILHITPEEFQDNQEEFESILKTQEEEDDTVKYASDYDKQWMKWISFINLYAEYNYEQKKELAGILKKYRETDNNDREEDREKFSEWIETAITKVMKKINKTQKITPKKIKTRFRKDE